MNWLFVALSAYLILVICFWLRNILRKVLFQKIIAILLIGGGLALFSHGKIIPNIQNAS